MPFVSEAQQGYLHEHPEILGKEKLAEFDAATKGMHNLPEHVHNGHPAHEHSHASYKMAREARKEKK
jgi:hypothetical protein